MYQKRKWRPPVHSFLPLGGRTGTTSDLKRPIVGALESQETGSCTVLQRGIMTLRIALSCRDIHEGEKRRQDLQGFACSVVITDGTF